MKTKAPIDATEDELDKMKTCHLEVGDDRILTDSFRVSITTQKSGEKPTQSVTIDRKTFDKLVRWYTTPQPLSTVATRHGGN